MKQAKIADLKNRLSYYLRRVRQGETIEVIDRDIAVARVVPIHPAQRSNDAWVQRLRRSGLVRSGPLRGVKEILSQSPAGSKSTGVLEALLWERREGR